MATITVRGLDDETKRLLRIRAAAAGRSMEAEVRAMLTAAVKTPEPGAWYERLRDALGEENGVDLDPYLPDRPEEPTRDTPFTDPPAHHDAA